MSNAPRTQSAPAPAVVPKTAAQASAQPWLWPLLLSLLITLVLLPLPRLPLGADDDSSWAAVLGYAHRAGLQFGTDILFTHGPLGFLLPPYFCVAAPGWRLCGDVAICFLAVLGLCLLAWRLPRISRWVMLASLVFLGANAEPRTELLLNLGLLGWTLLCLVQSGRRLWLAAAALVFVGVVGVLAKATLLFAVLGCIGVVVCDWCLRSRFQSALGLLLGFAFTLALSWVALGQSLAHLGPYLLSAVPISAGYQLSMGAEQLPFFVWMGLSILLLACLPTLFSCWSACNQTQSRSGWRRFLLSTWFLIWLFLIWKLGFVRVGRDHIEVFLCFVPLLVLALLVWPHPRPAWRYVTQGLATVVCLLSLLCLTLLFAGDYKACLAQPFWLAAQHAKALVQPARARQARTELQAAETSAMQLPRMRAALGSASVDVFGYSQSYAVLNALNYRPRPVFQSYAAYTPALMRANEQYYLGPNAPEYVLFRLAAIDDRFPPLEDAPLLRDLLLNYEPRDSEGPFLLLKQRSRQANNLKLVREGAVRPGELIDLRDQAVSDLWLQIDLEPTWLGRTRALLYQPSKVELGVWCQDHGKLRKADFNAPTSMLSAGFLASPLLLENDDVLGLYTGSGITRPVAFSIELPPGTESYWQPAVHFRIFQIQQRLGRDASPELLRLIKFPGFSVAPSAILAATNAIVQVAGQPALFVPPGGELRFEIPPTARTVTGKFGFAPSAYALGPKTEGAQFRIEEQLSDGSSRLLYSQTLTPASNPDDRGMKSFTVPCAGEGQRQLALRARAVSPSPLDITCWAEIAFQ